MQQQNAAISPYFTLLALHATAVMLYSMVKIIRGSEKKEDYGEREVTVKDLGLREEYDYTCAIENKGFVVAAVRSLLNLMLYPMWILCVIESYDGIYTDDATATGAAVMTSVMVFGWFALPQIMMQAQLRYWCWLMLADTWNQPRLTELRQKYRYFFCTLKRSIVFTNDRPSPFLCDGSMRFESSTLTGGIQSYRWCMWFLDRTFGNLYFRFFWPLYGTLIGASRRYHRAAKALDLKAGQRVLLLGAGAAPRHYQWKEVLGLEGHVVALDLQPGACDDSRRFERCFAWLTRSRQPMTDYVHGDNLHLPFKDGMFDAVVAVHNYVVDLPQCFRVLKPGGKVCAMHCGIIEGRPRRDQESAYKEVMELSDGAVFCRTENSRGSAQPASAPFTIQLTANS